MDESSTSSIRSSHRIAMRRRYWPGCERPDARLRILLVSHGYPPTFGGVETYLWDLSHELTRRGHHVLCLVGGDQASERFDEVLVERRAELTVAWLSALHTGESRWHPKPAARERLRAVVEPVLREFPPDLVHIQ